MSIIGVGIDVAEIEAPLMVMHLRGTPKTMQQLTHYDDLIGEICQFLGDRVQAALGAGIPQSRIVVDPGIGFGKRIEHNMQLLASLPQLLELRRPLLIGVSRKSMFATLLGRPVGERLAGGLAVAVTSVLAGAHIVRTHDVEATVDALKIATTLKASGYRISETEVGERL